MLKSTKTFRSFYCLYKKKKINTKNPQLHKSVRLFSLGNAYDFAQRNPRLDALLSAVFLSRAEHLYL